MSPLLSKIHGPLIVLVDIAILISLVSDWAAKHRSRKETATPTSAPTTTEEPADNE